MKIRAYFVVLFFIVILVSVIYSPALGSDLVSRFPEAGTFLSSFLSREYYVFSPSPAYFFLGRVLRLVTAPVFLASNFSYVLFFFSLLGFALFYLSLYKLTGNFIISSVALLSLAFFPLFWQEVVFAKSLVLSFFLFWAVMYLIFNSRLDWQSFALSGLAATSWSFNFLLLGILCFVYLMRKKFLLKVVPILKRLAVFFFSLLLFLLVVRAGGLPTNKILGSLKAQISVQNFTTNLFEFSGFWTASFWWTVLPLSFLGLVFNRKERDAVFCLLFSLFSLFWSEFSGLILSSVIFFFAGLGLYEVWQVLEAFSDTEIGTAIENRFFVLVFRLKKEAGFVKYLALGTLSFLSFLVPFFAVTQNYGKITEGAVSPAAFSQSAVGQLQPNSVIFASSGEVISQLRYYDAVTGKEPLLVTSKDLFGLTAAEELARIRNFYPDLEIPAVSENLAVNENSFNADFLRKFVSSNSRDWKFYYADSQRAQGKGRVVGQWYGFPLIADEPLYRISAN